MNVITIGGATIDVVVIGSNEEHEPGAKHDVQHIGFYPGGGAVNTALSFARHGASVKIMCAVGADMEGKWLEATLAGQGINVKSLEFIEGMPTGKAVIQQDRTGEVSVLAQRGASAYLSIVDGTAELSGQDLIYISSLSAKSIGPLAAALAGLKQKLPTPVVFNPSISHLREPSPEFKKLFHLSDIVCLNAAEARVLAGLKPEGMTSACSIKKVASLIDKLSLRRGQAALLTLGAHGAAFFDGVSTHFCNAAKVEVVSTLGAGDAFASSFVYELLSGEAPAKALVAATKAASLVLGQVSGNYAGAMLKHACNCE